MKRLLHILICVISLLATACTEVMEDFDLNTAEAKTVVDAVLTRDRAYVILSKTTSYLNLSKIPTGSPLKQCTTGKVSMGSVGEGYNPLMAVSSRCYCKKASPETVYDGVIFVANAHPTHPDED